ncbi:MAG: translation initiation factor IF-2 [Saccharospirillaceae bacterium]|nr:translation initiation factor IF-2 [Pseudomonadales bacterium]NRB77964.1 translation initiation factor IF-2 [Saccharospirillaceae bacterium]
MAEVTVKKLAEDVGTPVEKLLTQMQDSGLPHKQDSDSVTEEQKKTLLAHLKKSHGGSDEPATKKVTLTRKKNETLKAGKKAVNVEVRKKRTYVKPTQAAAKPVEKPVEKAVEAPVVKPVEKAVKAPVAKTVEKAAQKPVEQAVKKPAPKLAKKPTTESDKRRLEDDKLDQARLRDAKAKADKLAAIAAKKAAALKPAEKPAEKTAEKTAKPAEKAKLGAKTAAKPAPSRTDHKKKPNKEKSTGSNKEAEAKRARNTPTNRPQQKKKGNRHQQIMDVVGDNEGTLRRGRRRKPKINREHQFEKPTAPVIKEVGLGEAITLTDLALQLSMKTVELVKELFKLGEVANQNTVLDQDTAILLIEEMGHKYKIVNENEVEDSAMDIVYTDEAVSRAPVVTVMGHVDHGKTSLLDYIRSTKVTAGESGGITQHIGAYHVETDHGMITFLDTPGHAAFTAMRSRGAKATDIVILIVAADDGVMPQTEEAIQHALAAGVPIVVAINKMDREGADPERVKSELAAKGVSPEEWGGEYPFVEVSAHTGQGIDDLLEQVLLQSEVLELKAHATGNAKGVVIESRLDKGRGSVSTLLIQSGQLNKGDIVLAGETYGRVRAVLDEDGKPATLRGPSIPVEILGLDGTPDAGDEFIVVETERKAREVAAFRREKHRVAEAARLKAAKLDNLFANMEAGEVSSLNIIIKTDVRGSLEALQSSLLQIGNDEVKVNIVASGVGAISESDANLAMTSGAVIFGFNVRATTQARQFIESNGVDMRYYSVIYDILDDVKAALNGMLKPELRENIIGYAEVREVFNSPKFGLIAGSIVIEGTIHRSKRIRVLREDVVIYEGELESLRRFKDDVESVRQGTECGIGVKDYRDVKAGDKIEVFEVNEIARSLDD